MSNSGLKHAATEPSQLDKRQSRRGAGGRAAALRRAPSDSDCSGETASLSADSGDRVRPIPPPVRQGKSRSRRRGSEWEVLEGLKDGQRFDRRPDVFNGYLHKKRKWPLKGWHKRFFVVDGGILVYARSPTDVARGRLHGSVDVGLSVISAKARRRRIDIDADEFIYHLRAKTADVFRTWLTVLKAHRLYRQHLLTFGAREAAPKILPPLDDLPPTDTSSRTSSSSSLSTSCDPITTVTSVPSNSADLSTLHDVFEDSFGDNVALKSEDNIKNINQQPSCNKMDQRNVGPDNSSNTWVENSSCNCNDCSVTSGNSYSVDNQTNCPLCNGNRQNETPKDSLTHGDQPIKQAYAHKNESTFFRDRTYSYMTWDIGTPKTLNKNKAHNQRSKTKLRKNLLRIEKTKTKNQTQNSKVTGGKDMLKKSATLVLFNNLCQSLCSMHCVAKRSGKSDDIKIKDVDSNENTTDLIGYTDDTKTIAIDSTKNTTDLIGNSQLNSQNHAAFINSRKNTCVVNTIMKLSKKNNNVVTPYGNSGNRYIKEERKDSYAYFFSKERHSVIDKNKRTTDYAMNTSKKCTNLVKYKMAAEPPLPGPHAIKTLLKKDLTVKEDKLIGIELDLRKSNAVQVSLGKPSKCFQFIQTTSEYDGLTEQFITDLINGRNKVSDRSDINEFISKMVKEMYDIKIGQCESHPGKILFRCLLEYWIHNNQDAPSTPTISEDPKHAKALSVPSHHFFTKDVSISSANIYKETKDTQLQCEFMVDHKPNPKRTDFDKKHCLKLTDSYEKEQRIQKLERLLKNTVYICETTRDSPNREKDIKITKKLMDNIGKYPTKNISERSSNENRKEISISSAEYPKIEQTFNRLLSETSISVDLAKEFLGAYLEVLRNDSSKTKDSSTSAATSQEQISHHSPPVCDVQTESVHKKLNKSILALEMEIEKSDKALGSCNIDPRQLFLKELLDRLTSLFTQAIKPQQKPKEIQSHDTKVEGPPKNDFRKPTTKCNGKEILYQKPNENTLVLELSKYDLEQISMVSDPDMHGRMSIAIKIKERSTNFGESRAQNLCFKYSGQNPSIHPTPVRSVKNNCSTKMVFMSRFDPHLSVPNPFINYKTTSERYDLKPYLSSDQLSLSHSVARGSKSLHCAFHNHRFDDESNKSFAGNEDQSCYVVTNWKNQTLAILQGKKKNVETGDGTIAQMQAENVFRQHSDTESLGEVNQKFVAALFDNILSISETLPVLHREIKSLRAKFLNQETADMICEPQVVGLLGNIYDGPTYADVECNQTKSAESLVCNCSGVEVQVTQSTIWNQYIRECCVNTKPVFTNQLKNYKVERSVSPILFKRVVQDCGVQTKNLCSQKVKIHKSVKINVPSTTRLYPNSFIPIFGLNDNATDKKTPSYWYDHLVNKELSSAIRNMILVKDSQNFRLISKEDAAKYTEKRSQCQKPRSKVTSAKSRVSTQTERHREYRNDCSVNYIFLRDSCFISANKINKSDDMMTIYRCASDSSFFSGLISPTMPPLRGPQAGFVSGTPGGRLASWIIESGGPLENASRELGQAQLSVQQLQRLLDALELQHQTHHDTDVSLEGASPNVKKDRRKFGLRKKKSTSSKCASVELAPLHMDPSNSHMGLSALTAPPSPGGGASSVPNSAASLPIACAATRPQSLPGAESLGPAAGPASLTSLTPDQQLREDFTVLAKDLVATLKGVVSTLVCERGRLRAAMEAAESTASPGGAVMAALRTNLSCALQQNSELRSRLSRIHDASDIAEISSVNNTDPVNKFQQSLSYSSSCVSASEFFDAEEHDDDLKETDILAADEAGVIELDGDSTSEAGSLSSEDGSGSSENSDAALLSAEPVTLTLEQNGSVAPLSWRRRTALPAPRPTPGGPSLWNLLYKNIGKDLSQISMPVTINEPLNMLQRLCEELEYSELLDSAADCPNSVERMALIAAFAVSAYAASAHRAASKPFNPLLAETYECVRDDRGFRFLAEQVSHHPPISACHAESPRWCFWQEARIKTKFWGKSMEFQPTGRVHVRLLNTGDHYSWNKVTTCVHNLFGGQRWVDQYGDMLITCHGTEISCKLNFIKASSWSSSRHEVRGFVTDGSSGTRLRLQGRWSEALYAGEPPAARCLWRPGAMPPEHEIYYGFTRFAMELNEMEPGMRDLLPPTDTRLRPDQRALEQGDVESAEQLKHSLEQAQRERRRDSPAHTPMWFRKLESMGEEAWVFTGEYWSARNNGFKGMRVPSIW